MRYYRDPTADEAIGRVMRQERKKRKAKAGGRHMSEINDTGYLRLLDAVYEQAISDIITAWRFYEQHGKTEIDGEESHITKKRKKVKSEYNSAVGFLRKSEKGKRILKLMTEADDEQRKRLLKSGIHTVSKN